MRIDATAGFVAAALLAGCYGAEEVGAEGQPDAGDTDSDGDGGTDGGPDAGIDWGWHDTGSDLVWEDPPQGGSGGWSDAYDYCAALEVEGHASWRLPTIDELRTLVRGCPQTEPGGGCPVVHGSAASDLNAACEGCAPLGGPGAAGCYWDHEVAGTCGPTWSYSQVLYDFDRAWLVDFDRAGVGETGLASAWPAVRCVHDVE